MLFISISKWPQKIPLAKADRATEANPKMRSIHKAIPKSDS